MKLLLNHQEDTGDYFIVHVKIVGKVQIYCVFLAGSFLKLSKESNIRELFMGNRNNNFKFHNQKY